MQMADRECARMPHRMMTSSVLRDIIQCCLSFKLFCPDPSVCVNGMRGSFNQLHVGVDTDQESGDSDGDLDMLCISESTKSRLIL
jgi:hypothetical protein